MKMKMKHLSIDIMGETQGDLEIALEEVKKKVAQGYLSGQDANDTGSFLFEIQED